MRYPQLPLRWSWPLWISWTGMVSYLLQVGQSAWYCKELPTFSDALALVRFQFWDCVPTFLTSRSEADMTKVPHTFAEMLIETLVYDA